MLDQIAQHGIGEPVLVRPLRVAKDAVELVRVGRFNGPHGGLERRSDILGRLPHVAPVGFLGNLEAVVLRIRRKRRIAAGLLQRRLCFLVKHVAEAFVEQQREDELLVVARINRPAQERGRAPEVGFELLLGDTGGHFAAPQGFWATTLPSCQT